MTSMRAGVLLGLLSLGCGPPADESGQCLARLEVTVAAPQAGEVTLDDVSIGKAPIRRRCAPLGEHTIAITAGERFTSRVIQIDDGDHVSLHALMLAGETKWRERSWNWAEALKDVVFVDHASELQRDDDEARGRQWVIDNRLASDAEQSANLTRLMMRPSDSTLHGVLKEMDQSDYWLLPVLISLVRNSDNEGVSWLATEKFWHLFPTEAQRLVVERGSTDTLDLQPGFLLEASHRGALPAAATTVLAAGCGKDADAWGFTMVTGVKETLRWSVAGETGQSSEDIMDVGFVCPHSAAEATGLKAGDRILAIDDIPVRDLDVISGLYGSKDLDLLILRDGKELGVRISRE